MVNRDRLTFLGSGLFGDNTTSAGEGIVAGIFRKILDQRRLFEFSNGRLAS